MDVPVSRHVFRQPDDRKVGTVHGGGYIIDKQDELSERRLGSYALVYLLDGGGWYQDPDHPHRSVARGDVLVLTPNRSHGYGRGTAPRWSEAWLMFRGPVFAGLERDGVIDAHRPVLSPGYDQGLVAGFDQIIRELADPGHDRAAGLVARTHLLITEILRLDAARATNRSEADLVASACAALEQRLLEPIDLHDLARRLGCSYERFRKQFAKRMGMSPSRYRVVRRIDLAKGMLADGATIEEVATRLGWCDQFFLARQFRTITGMNPGAWRKQWRGDEG